MTPASKARRTASVGVAAGVAALLVFGLASCSGSSGKRPSPSASTTVAADAPDAVGAINARLNPDGTIGKDLALDLYSSLIAPLPGWTVKQKVPTEGMASATMAVRGILAHLDELTAQQRAAVQDRLHSRGGGPAATPSRTTHSLSGLPANRRRTDDLDLEIGYVVDLLSSRLGRRLAIPVTHVVEDDAHFGLGPSTYAYTTPSSASGDDVRMAECTITFRDGITRLSPANRREIVAHEVYHCFQDELFLDDVRTLDSRPAWLVEGQAAWVGEELSGGGFMSPGWWRHWLTLPGADLVGRSYDAMGYYATLDAVTHGVWGVLDGMLRDPGSAYDRTATPAVRQQWATGLVRRPAYGPQWESVGPGITADHADPSSVTLVRGAASAAVPLPHRHSVALVAMQSTGDVVRVDPPRDAVGALRTGSGTVVPLSLNPVLLCLRGDHCRCPDGSSPGGQTYVDAGAGQVVIAVQSDSGGAVSLNQQDQPPCAPSPTATPVAAIDQALVGTWVSDRWTTPPVVGTAQGGAGMTLTFSAGAEMTADFDAMRVVTISNQGVVTQFRYSGTSDGTWRTHDGQLHLDYSHPRQLRVKIAIPTAGFNYDEDFASAASGSIGPLTAVDYRVSGSTLTVTMPIPRGLGSIVIRFHRR